MATYNVKFDAGTIAEQPVTFMGGGAVVEYLVEFNEDVSITDVTFATGEIPVYEAELYPDAPFEVSVDFRQDYTPIDVEFVYDPFSVDIDFQTGIQGPAGEDGNDGSTWLNFNGPPAPSTGNPLDYYLDTTSYDLYQKDGDGNWNIIGNIRGPQGPAGDSSGTVPAGGTVGQALVKQSATDYDTTWSTIESDVRLVHVQGTPANPWIITHNLGKNPAVQVENNSGEIVIADVVHDNINQVTISFSGDQGGKAYFN